MRDATDPASAADAVVRQIADWAAQGASAPARLLGGARGFVEWAHYPQPDAIDPQSGWKFYYHAHAASQRPQAEHGHFHIFVPAPAPAADGAAAFSHLVGLSVDARGLPLRWFTTNRWVTSEVWQSAEALSRFLDSPRLSAAEPRDVAQWLQHLLLLFRDDIRALLQARDARIAAPTGRGQHAAASRSRFDDHRLRIVSQRRAVLARRLVVAGQVARQADSATLE